VYGSSDGGDTWDAIVRDLPAVVSVEVQTLASGGGNGARTVKSGRSKGGMSKAGKGKPSKGTPSVGKSSKAKLSKGKVASKMKGKRKK
jgi:hypothetical protein